MNPFIRIFGAETEPQGAFIAETVQNQKTMKAIDFERIPDDRNEPTKPYTFCICGGGALGHVLAGVIGAQGYDVRMLTGHPDAWQSEITVEDCRQPRARDGCTRSPTVRNAPQVRPTSCCCACRAI